MFVVSPTSRSPTRVDIDGVCMEPFAVLEEGVPVERGSATTWCTIVRLEDSGLKPGLMDAVPVSCGLKGLVAGELTKLAFREC